MTTLSVAIVARDEERHIGAALDSCAGLTNDILVLLDHRTRDRTAEICHAHGARVVVETWRGFAAQRNRALDLSTSDWVLFLDADERLTPELRDEMLHALAQQPTATDRNVAGYWIPRYNQFFDQTLRGGGWYPDHQLRLLRRRHARYDESRLVHEFADLTGTAAYLSQHLLHLNIERFDELWNKQTGYAIQEAQTLYRSGRRARWRNFLGAPAREFYRRYIALSGYRDGAIGLLLCATLAYFELVKYTHLKGLALLQLPVASIKPQRR